MLCNELNIDFKIWQSFIIYIKCNLACRESDKKNLKIELDVKVVLFNKLVLYSSHNFCDKFLIIVSFK